MNPLAELRRLLGVQSGPVTGLVSSVSDVIMVTTSTGPVQASANFSVSVGDTVLLEGGVIKGKIQAQEDRPLYYL